MNQEPDGVRIAITSLHAKGIAESQGGRGMGDYGVDGLKFSSVNIGVISCFHWEH